jgi:hypothetical protein
VGRWEGWTEGVRAGGMVGLGAYVRQDPRLACRTFTEGQPKVLSWQRDRKSSDYR